LTPPAFEVCRILRLSSVNRNITKSRVISHTTMRQGRSQPDLGFSADMNGAARVAEEAYCLLRLLTE